MLDRKGKFNSRDYAIIQVFFIGKWRVRKLSLWAEPEYINHYSGDSSKTFYHLVNRWYPLDQPSFDSYCVENRGGIFS